MSEYDLILNYLRSQQVNRNQLTSRYGSRGEGVPQTEFPDMTPEQSSRSLADLSWGLTGLGTPPEGYPGMTTAGKAVGEGLGFVGSLFDVPSMGTAMAFRTGLYPAGYELGRSLGLWGQQETPASWYQSFPAETSFEGYNFPYNEIPESVMGTPGIQGIGWGANFGDFDVFSPSDVTDYSEGYGWGEATESEGYGGMGVGESGYGVGEASASEGYGGMGDYGEGEW